MRLLLTSNGITNPTIESALVDLVGKPIAESTALIVPTGIYPVPGGQFSSQRLISGVAASPFVELGWKSLGVLELTALTSIQEDSWIPLLKETDVLYVWGGSVLYLTYWMKRSGLAELLPHLDNLVYVGCSAGSIVTTPHNCDFESNIRFVPSQSEMANEGDRALGFTDFALCVHLDSPEPVHEDATLENFGRWAEGVPVPTYAIDDQSAVKVIGDHVEVVSEGHWKRFEPGA